jgi:hypothetical protein
MEKARLRIGPFPKTVSGSIQTVTDWCARSKLKISTMSYYRLVISRAFAKTKEFWNLHQSWKYTSTPISAIFLRLAIKRLSPVMGWEGFLKEALLFVVCGFIVSWVGSYFINLIQVPPLIYREQQTEITHLKSEAQQLAEAEIQRKKVDFDFRLHIGPDSSVRIPVQITPVQSALVNLCGLWVKVWNKGENHLQLSKCKLSSESSSLPRTIKTDVHVQPNGEESLDITEEMAPLIFVQKNWQGFPETQEINIEVECTGESGHQSTKSKSYRLQVKKTGGFSVLFTASPS